MVSTCVLNKDSQNKAECSTPAEIKVSIVTRTINQRKVERAEGNNATFYISETESPVISLVTEH